MGKSASGLICVLAIFLSLTLAVSAVRADDVRDAVDRVSQGQYRTYQIEVESMGLGLYGGSAYDQGYRNRDGWPGGGTLGNEEARLYLADQFAAMGLAVSVQGTYRNVIGELPGREKSEEIYIVSAHFDTTSGTELPGGDDNASGVAGVLEAARVLTQYRFKSTLRFIGFNAEEDGLDGSQDYIDTVILPNNENIKGVINLDTILRPAWDEHPEEPEDLDVIIGRSAVCLDWANSFLAAIAKYELALAIDPDAPLVANWYASDQGFFIEAGFPALLAAENAPAEIKSGSNAYYHSTNDASNHLANDPNSPSGVVYNYAFATDVVRATVATVARAAEPLFRSEAGFSLDRMIATKRAEDLEFFRIGDTDFLAVAQGRNETTYSVDSLVYRGDGAGFIEYQRIATHGARDWEFFTIAGAHYLAVANHRDDSGYAVNSQIYRWDGNVFVAHQSLPTNGASDWEFFTIDDAAYLAVANMDADSRVYRWNGRRFVEFGAIPSRSAGDCEFFTLGENLCLAIAAGNESQLYVYRTACAGSLDDDCDVDLSDYAILSRTWRLEPDRPGWSADCDLSRPRDGVVDARDLAILASNWLREQRHPSATPESLLSLLTPTLHFCSPQVSGKTIPEVPHH